MSDLIFHAGAECYNLYGTLSKRTSSQEDVAETFTRTGTAYFVDRNGVLKLAEANALRTEWTGSDFSTPNLLLEDARTNGWTYSEQLDNAAWTKGDCTISANATTAPDGATTADKIVETAATNPSHSVSRNTPSLTDDTDQPLSFFAKAAERIHIKIQTSSKAGAVSSSWVNLSTGAAGTTAAGHTITVTPRADGWYRIEVIWDSGNGGSTPSANFGPADSDNNGSYLGDVTKGLYVWGMQFEADEPHASSYIQTVASTVTRTIENFFGTFYPHQIEHTWYFRFIESGSINKTNAGIFRVSDSGGNVPSILINANASDHYFLRFNNGTATSDSETSVTPSIGDVVELRAVLSAAGAAQIAQSINSAAEVVTAAGTARAFSGAWAGDVLSINSHGTGNAGFNKFQSIKAARGTKTMAEMRALGV